MTEITLSPGSLKVLSVLISPTKEYNVHGLAARANLSAMGVSKVVRQLRERGLVTIRVLGRSYLIKLNKSSQNILPFCLAEQYRFHDFIKTHLPLKGFLISIRNKLEDKATFSLIFGSYASGEESASSDLDLLIVTSHKKEALNIIKTAKVLVDIELSPIIVTLDEFITKLKEKHRLYTEIINGKRVILTGEYDFWRIVLKRI
ncbi:nucleotidyltransferase domain-containing protein [Candidatus Woesearchaeota archaeon]|nr:nucleotidyltransferase domain-containing protein [Candidatus Woesearchaeota archaeon]